MPKACPTCQLRYPDSAVFCPVDGAVLRADLAAESLLGTIVAERYLVTEKLGEGGMGTVYRGQHVKLPREAAIKVMHASLMRDPEAIARFGREAAAASRLSHDAVARVYDHGETADGLVYLAMEFVEGRTLKQVLRDDGALPLERAAALLLQVAAGLDAAHRAGIVHRDLKPDNVLVTRDAAGREQVKLVDFGIAKAVGAGERSLTRTGFVVGTPEYMSPEQLVGEAVDARSDVYALAVLAYQLVSGHMPFDASTPDRGLMARLTTAPRPLSVVRPDVAWPQAVQVVLDRGLHRDRAHRTPSALEFARTFNVAVTLAPTRGPSPQLATPVVPPAAMSPPPHPVLPPPPQVTFGTGHAPRRWPQLPVVGLLVTASVLGFGYLVATEGSVNGALRKARALVQQLESRGP